MNFSLPFIKQSYDERAFTKMLNQEPLSLFRHIPSETSDQDKESLLALLSWVRKKKNKYCFLEIGSYHGGTIQPFLQDPKCERIFSIDKRPDVVKDLRGITFTHYSNSEKKMVKNLQQISPKEFSKVTIYKLDSSQVPKEEISPSPDICFIDGEHTDSAVIHDFEFCKNICAKRGTIVIHDAELIFAGITEIISQLKAEHVQFTAFVLPQVLFVISFDKTISEDPLINMQIRHNYEAYLLGLKTLEPYRTYALSHGFKNPPIKGIS